MSMFRRVVVTGMGAISPVGLNAKECFRRITDMPFQSPASKLSFADSVVHSVADPGPSSSKHPRFIEFGLNVARQVCRYESSLNAQAIADSGYEITDKNRCRIGFALFQDITKTK